MPSEQLQLEAAIQALEAQRRLLGDAVVDAMLAPARVRLSALATPSAPSAEPAQTLKQVSILFLDVVGSTALAQRLDPEAVSAVMDDALSRGTITVQAHRGRVLQYAGDNILAAFGVDGAREDDAQSAVQCGLALLGLGQALSAEVLARYGHAGVDVRVGVHTGGVLLGGGVDAEGTIRGSAVNIAARMEQTAPAGALRISHDTYAQVRGMFEVEAQEALVVKGIVAPVQSYLVLGAKPRSFRIGTRGVEGVPTRMIGRDAELEALQAAFQRLLSDRRFAAVTVVAEAGIGKSRLLYEFDDWSETRTETFDLFRGRSSPATGARAFGLLYDVIAGHFQINDNDSVEVARLKIEDGIVPLFVHDDGPDLAEGHAHLLGHLIGIEWKDSRHIRGILDDPKQIRNRAFHAAAQLFRRVSATDGNPVVLQLEDLHWADSESLDFLSYLAEVNHDVPMLVLSFTRPTLFERRTDWSSTEGVHRRIDLAALDKRASRDLATELLKKLPEIPATLRDLLTNSAAGNPFYMEELLKMLIAHGAIESGESWKVHTEKLLLAQVPSTLTGVLQARLDSLPAAERHALQQASVIGSTFWDKALLALDAQAVELLPTLEQRDLIRPLVDAPLDGMRTYAFCHQLLHQVIYDTVLKRQKQEYHARVGRWLAALNEQDHLRAGEYQALAAEHFEKAGDGVSATEFYILAAERAVQRFAHGRVIAHVGRALALMGTGEQPGHQTSAELRWRLLSARELTLHLQGMRDEQAVDLNALAVLADELNDNVLRADVAFRRSRLALRLADWVAMEDSANNGAVYATLAGDDSRRLEALNFVAFGRVQLGAIDAGRRLSLRCLAEAKSFGFRHVEARFLNTLATAAFNQGDLLASLDMTRQALEAFSESGDRIGEAIGLANLGDGWLKLGDLVQAERDLNSALHLLRANGDRAIEAATLGQLSTVKLWQGNEPQALSMARSGLDIAEAAKALDVAVNVGLRLGDAELTLGRLSAAREAYAQALTRAMEIDSPWQLDACAGVARVELAAGDTARSVAALQPILEHVGAAGELAGTEYPRLIELTCYQALNRAGDPQADSWLTRAHTALIAQADAISQHGADPTLRQGFLKNVPHHREIAVSCAKRGKAAAVRSEGSES